MEQCYRTPRESGRFFMHGTTSDTKQLMENMVMHREPVQLSESGF